MPPANTWTPPPRLGEYALVKLIGQGAMGQVFLAEDTLLDRPVAVKFLAGAPDEASRRDLLMEARAVARLSHPNVVAVHRVGEVDGRPYLVTELVRGAGLDEVEKPLREGEVLAVGRGIARGLGAAHRKGVLHRDVKPANVMLAEDGAVKLLDFGLAKIAGAPPALGDDDGVVGTPLYMAPEVLSGAEASARSDVYSVGVLLYELCTGIAPREALPRETPVDAWINAQAEPLAARAPGVDRRLAAIVDRCLERDPARRFPSADALGDALAAVVDAPVAVPLPAGNPYRGLGAFGEEHRAVFFGRAAESRAVLDRLRAGGLVVVSGDSGVGKSSLCRAGVLPLVGDGGLGDGRRALTAAIVPGAHPLAALAAAVAPVLGLDEAELARHAGAGPDALARAVRAALGADRGLVLFVDQAEELCTLADPAEAAAFTEVLAALPAPSAGVRLLVAARGDYFTRIAALPGIGDELSRALYLLRPLSPEGVRAAVTGPAAPRGVRFEPESLVDTLVAAAAGPGGLPLLQFALAELWEARGEGDSLNAAALQAMGGVEGALARHADEALFGLPPEARAAARRVLLRLVTAERTRARRTAAELGADDEATGAALEALVRGRLVVAGEGGGETAYELAHEALVHVWQTLRRWLDETDEQKRLLDELERAAELWSRRGRRAEETWRGDALAQAAHRAGKGGLDVPPLVRAFLEAGQARERAEQQRRRRLTGAAVGALALLAAGSSAAALAFRDKERQAVRQQAEIRLAAADLGELDLVLAPFDWDPVGQRATPVSAPPALDFRLHAVAPDRPDSPGRPYGPDDLRRGARRAEGTSVRERVEARSGPAFLEITGRGEGCGSSWVRLQRLPGYRERVAGTPAEVRIPVPTCQATGAGMVEIPAGEFYRNVEGAENGAPTVDEVVDLPVYSIDRTEVTRGAFAVYSALEALTGEAAARTAYLQGESAGGERLPVVGVNASTAAAYCRFLGKALPSLEQWQKALRGAIVLDGRPNPAPKRITPWVKATSAHPRNIDDGDPFANLAPVGSFPEDVSPYGVVDLGGNVSEWSRTEVTSAGMRGLRFVLGANWDAPAAHAHWRNVRPDRYLDFGIGVRCVREPSP